MQDKRPYNKQGQAHGYWEATWRDGGWYKGNFAYHKPLGYFIIKWVEDIEIEYNYYAR